MTPQQPTEQVDRTSTEQANRTVQRTAFSYRKAIGTEQCSLKVKSDYKQFA